MRLYFRWKLFLGFFGFAIFVAGLLTVLLLLQLSSAGAEGKVFLPRLRPFLYWALASLGLASIAPALWIASRLNRPIRLLHEAMQQVSGGRLETKIPPIRTYDEFEILIENFNQMVAGLGERAELLAERDRFLAQSLDLICLAGSDGFRVAPPESEDCLFLNVWTLGVGATKKRPVMVWLHGGVLVPFTLIEQGIGLWRYGQPMWLLWQGAFAIWLEMGVIAAFATAVSSLVSPVTVVVATFAFLFVGHSRSGLLGPDAPSVPSFIP